MVIKVKNKEAIKELKIKLFDLRVEKKEHQKRFNEIESELRKEMIKLETECDELATLKEELSNKELTSACSDERLVNMLNKTKMVDTSTKNLYQNMRTNLDKLNRIFKVLEVLITKENMLVEMMNMQMKTT